MNANLIKKVDIVWEKLEGLKGLKKLEEVGKIGAIGIAHYCYLPGKFKLHARI
jgi:hypothetical protein